MPIHYLIKTQNTRRAFVLLDHRQEVIADLQYPQWLSTNARFTLAGREFRIMRTGLWQGWAIYEGQQPRGKIRVSWQWNGKTEIELGTGADAVVFRVRRPSIFGNTYRIDEPQSRNSITQLRTRFNWRTFRQDVEVEWHTDSGNDFSRALLLVAAGYLINVVRRRNSG